MFRQFVTPNQYTLNPASKDIKNNINSLFTYHPLQLSAIIETVWLNRYNATPTPISSPFVPWPLEITYPILNAPFIPDIIGPLPLPVCRIPPRYLRCRAVLSFHRSSSQGWGGQERHPQYSHPRRRRRTRPTGTT